MKNRTYTTKEVADIAGIHVNTVRFYEDVGFITKPDRKQNGYRVFTELHIDECSLIKLAMRAEVLQNGLRDKAVEIVMLAAKLEYDDAICAVIDYQCMLKKEIDNAKVAINSVESILSESIVEKSAMLKRKEAAQALGVTSETVRTWERSGLIKVKRTANGYRVYNGTDMERLNIIRTLRCANYSLAAILRLLNLLDKHTTQSVESILNTPCDDDDIISACDRLIISLKNTLKDAEYLKKLLMKMSEKYSTLHLHTNL